MGVFSFKKLPFDFFLSLVDIFYRIFKSMDGNREFIPVKGNPKSG
jgi:hypothetical protein